MDHRQYFKDLIRPSADGTKPCDEKITFQDVKLINALLECQNRYSSSFLNLSMEDGVRWIFGYSNYINQSLLKEQSKLPLKHTYSKGSIVLVDFFGHFGSEMAFDHPAIVLGEVGHDLIVAPITSNEKIFENDLYYHVKLDKGVPTLGDMPNNSTIKLEQVRFISKRRLLVNFKKRVSDNGKLEEIDIALMKVLASYTFNKHQEEYAALERQGQLSMDLIESSLDHIETLSMEYEELTEEHEALLKENEKLRAEIQELKNQTAV